MSNFMIVKSNDDLQHHGIKGQKWGVRRFQNPDGSLTAAGQKRYGKQYKKLAVAATKDYTKHGTQLYVKAQNRAAEQFNKTIEEFNKKYDVYDDAYTNDIDKYFDSLMNKAMNEVNLEYLQNSEYFRKADDFAKKYGLYSVNDLAKENAAVLAELERKVKGG